MACAGHGVVPIGSSGPPEQSLSFPKTDISGNMWCKSGIWLKSLPGQPAARQSCPARFLAELGLVQLCKFLRFQAELIFLCARGAGKLPQQSWPAVLERRAATFPSQSSPRSLSSKRNSMLLLGLRLWPGAVPWQRGKTCSQMECVPPLEWVSWSGFLPSSFLCPLPFPGLYSLLLRGSPPLP